MQVSTGRGARAAALGVAALLAAGCGSTAAGHRTRAALPAANAVKLAANQASQASSITATINMQMSGQRPATMQGTMAMRTRPALAMDMNIASMTVNGHDLPGGMREILVGNGLYLSTRQLSRMAGRPWVMIPASTLNQATGNAFSQLEQQLQQQDPLSSARMLGAAKNVKQTGTGTVGGVPVTRYSGTIPVQDGLSMLSPQLRELEQRALSSLGVSVVPFSAAVDQQHQIRQLEEWMTGTSERMVTTVSVTGLNQPVSVQPPPASQVGRLPAGGPSSGSASGSGPGTAG
jgi:hypothetical protein